MFDFLFKKKTDYESLQVGDFYNKNHDAFIKVYGEVIQAFRTNNLDNILNSQIESIGLKEGQHVLDAGCGVCGPARYFAKKTGCNIDAVTISEVQLKAANKHIQQENLAKK
jgi:cyclopropane fatty-acyl-phospholipid synthase-like methyltransferase